MAQKVLLAVDNSQNSLNAIRYVANTVNRDADITMLSILPDPTAACGLDGPSLTPIFRENIQAFCAIENAKESAMEGFMEEAKKTLVKAGFPSKNILIKIRKKSVGIARDILKEAEKGKYDTLVVGRRGSSAAKQFIMGSISQKIVNETKGRTVITVR